MMVAVLLGALTLGACVDDNESQSVTDVRNAKAEQLKAMAEYDKARAEAALIQANAQKAYNEAQAEFFKAQAAVQNAMAADKEFQLQKLKDQYAAELEAINLEAQNRLLAAKIDAAEKEQAFLALANELLQGLYRKYADEVEILDGYKTSLNYWNTQVANLEVEAISVDQANAAAKAVWENENLKYQAQIDAYKSYEGKDRSELEAEAKRLEMVKTNLNMTYLNAGIATNTAREGYTEAVLAFNPYAEAVEATPKTVLAAKTLMEDFGFIFYWDEDYSDFLTEKVVLYKEGYSELYVQRYSLKESPVEVKRQDLAKIEKELKADLGAKKTDKVEATGLYKDLADAEKDLADATTAKDEAKINSAKLRIAEANDKIAAKLKEIEEAAQDIKDFEAAIASFAGEDLKAYDAALAALKENKAVVAYIAAMKAESEAYDAYYEADAQYTAVNNLVEKAVDAKAQILSLENSIAENLKNIAAQSNDKEIALQQAKDMVTKYTTQVELQEAVVALAKKNLDAAIAAQEEE